MTATAHQGDPQPGLGTTEGRGQTDQAGADNGDLKRWCGSVGGSRCSGVGGDRFHDAIISAAPPRAGRVVPVETGDTMTTHHVRPP